MLLARWLCTDPEVLILDEPTRGIDVGAKQEIQNLVRELADDGLSVLLISSELEELITDADRVVVLRDGATVAELEGEDISEKSMLHAMAEGTAADRAPGHRVPARGRRPMTETATAGPTSPATARRPAGRSWTGFARQYGRRRRSWCCCSPTTRSSRATSSPGRR